MIFWKKFFFSCGIICILLFISIISFLWWNHYPPLPLISEGPIEQLLDYTPSLQSKNNLKIITYNIHFGIGYDWNRKDNLDKASFCKRLDKLSHIIRQSGADIVFLQEVDFKAQRTQNIDQGNYIAKKAGYPFIAKATHLRERFHPSIQNMHGSINHGNCILSKFPLEKNIVKVFPHPEEVPFYLRWIFTPHGMQMVNLRFNERLFTLINVHLEPWSQKTREKEMEKMASEINHLTNPVIIAGDFNAIPPETPKKMGYYLNDAPWFIDTSKWDIENETTIKIMRKIKNISEAIFPTKYLKNEKAYYTFPAKNPVEKLDYIFLVNGIKILYGFVFHQAKTASDHLPLVALIRTQPAKIPPITIQKNSQ